METSPAWLAVATLAAGILAVAASFIDKTLFFSLYSLSGEGLDAETARVLFLTARASFLLFGLFAGAMAGIAAISIFRYRPFGVWLGWLGALAGVAGIVSVLAPDSPVGHWILSDTHLDYCGEPEPPPAEERTFLEDDSFFRRLNTGGVTPLRLRRCSFAFSSLVIRVQFRPEGRCQTLAKGLRSRGS